MTNKKYGQCLLTGKEGRLVKCHIVPRALTKPLESGAPLLQTTRGKGYTRRWTSWYDNSIVTRFGEDSLSLIDDRAIKELRKKKLVWSGWGVAPPIFESLSHLSPEHGFRILNGVDSKALFLFFWSIAWRASVANIPDMRNFKLPDSVERAAHEMIVADRADFLKYPVTLMQLSTRGEHHNQTPLLDEKIIPSMNGGSDSSLPMARIYVDGLMAHLHFEGAPSETGSNMSPFLEYGKDILVPSVSYEISYQYENMLALAYESLFGPVSN